MMLPAPGFRDANILTRTTLQVDESLSTLSVAQLVHALQGFVIGRAVFKPKPKQ